MFVRYMLEAALFIILAILIQVALSNFYVDLNKMVEWTNLMRKMRSEDPEGYGADPEYKQVLKDYN